jgi:hypothetical protein
MKWAALGLTLFLMGLALYAVWFLGGLPGRVAAERNHPRAEAINVGSWAALLMGVVGWPWVLMWAYSHPAPDVSPEASKQLSDESTGEPE